jgi:hypothetical protein
MNRDPLMSIAAIAIDPATVEVSGTVTYEISLPSIDHDARPTTQADATEADTTEADTTE